MLAPIFNSLANGVSSLPFFDFLNEARRRLQSSLFLIQGRLKQLASETVFVPSSEASAEEQTIAKASARHQQQGFFVAACRTVVLPRPIQAG